MISTSTEDKWEKDTKKDIRWKVLQHSNQRQTKESIEKCSKKGHRTTIGGPGLGEKIRIKRGVEVKAQKGFWRPFGGSLYRSPNIVRVISLEDWEGKSFSKNGGR